MRIRNISKHINRFTKFLFIFTFIIAFSGLSHAAKYKVGVSVPSADHGWTAGLLWWANKAVEDIGATDKDVEFFVVAASSGTKQVGT